jgi:hypothetical protein
MNVLSLLLIATGCTEYGISANNDVSGSDTGASTIPDSGDTAALLEFCGEIEDFPSEEVPLNTECDLDLQTGSFSPVQEWTYGQAAFCGPAAVAQIVDSNGNGSLDGDDLPVILLYQNNQVHAVRGDGSGLLWAATSRSYGNDGGFAVGDVTGDGWPDVITASTNMVCALDGRTGAEHWCNTQLAQSMDSLGYNYPSVADMDGDGLAEVTVGNAILHGATGELRGRGAGGKGAAPYDGTGNDGFYGTLSVPIDLDGDGIMELVTGNTAYTADGAIVWQNGLRDGLVAIADFDLDGQGEIVVTSGIYISGLETDGSLAWGPLDYKGSNRSTNLGAVAIDDLDGDGVPEIVFAASNRLVAMEWGGEEIWNAPISDSSGAAGPTLFDFEMDGYPEVLYADETSVRFFSGVDGSVKFSSSAHESYTILETPIVADVDGDDQVEIIVGHCATGRTYTGITVYGDADQSWPPGRKVWNQHAYSITNIDDLGGVPAAVESPYALYNSFRSGDVGRPPSEYWDLRAEVLDVCEDECGTGDVYVAARLLNAGNLEAPAGIPISLRAGPGGAILATDVTLAPIASGENSRVFVLSAPFEDLAGVRPLVTADEDENGVGTVFECDENNNPDDWFEAVCVD